MQRITREPSPTSAEELVLSSGEAEVGFRAVRYLLETGIQMSGPNESGLLALSGDFSESRNYVVRVASFVDRCARVATKLIDSMKQPEVPLDLTVEELFNLGAALPRLGRMGLRHARLVISDNGADGTYMGWSDETSRESISLQAETTARAAHVLFDEITPIGLSKDRYRVVGWPIWE